ncbi:SBBP repeat-containing protein [Paenibacillus polysaccharolyticus]|uniref:S-layer homology domain-containing protein n=1 Tax=Paenibacillus polysaccharolyticus TaxID=582692 RepID=UPI00209E57C5|nr:SBBP repeat-containing protein [Paenibacillus polysaccharolyticus]
MNHQRKAKQWLRKLYILSMALIIACSSILEIPAYAAETWSQFGRIGSVFSSNPGGFAAPKGVTVDNSGNVYVADSGNHRIQKLTLSTNTWSEWKKVGGGAGSGLGEFNNPTAVAVDSSGNVYVADSGNHRIQKLTLSTNTWSEWKKVGGGNGLGLGEFNNPRGVAVDSSGNVYVADSSNHRIQKLTLSTNTWSVWKKPSAGAVAGNGLGEFNFPNGVAVDSSGNVYVGDSNNHRIQKLTLSTNTWSEWKKVGSGAGAGLGEFNTPRAVAVDGSGNIYVADTGNHRIQKLNAATGTWSEWVKNGGGSGNSLGEFINPNGVAVDNSGNVYVADDSNRIQKLTAANNTWSEWSVLGPVNGISPGEFTFPRGVAVDSSGNVYVADTSNHRIQKLNKSTNTWSEWKKVGGGNGSGLGEFYNPFGVAVDSSGNVYVADSGNHRIQKLTLSTNTWSEWKKDGGGTGTSLGEFNTPYGVAVDLNGNVYVADSGNHRIQKLTLSTNTWSDWKKVGGGNGSGLGEFSVPGAVAVDLNGNVYVADSGNHRIQKLTLSTNTWSEWKKDGGGNGTSLGEFNNPRAVAVDSSGNLYVADSGNHRIQKLTLPTNTWSEWKKVGGGTGTSLGEFNTPYGVAVDSSGNVYVADSANHRMQKLDIPSSAIIDFASTAKTSTTASFSWTAASGATGILIEQSPAGANTWTTTTIGAIATNSTTATVTGLSAATAYDFRLVVSGGANAGNSNTVSVTTDNVPTYTIAEIADQTATELTAGYSSGTQDTKTITITKTGTGDLTNVATALSGTNATDFVITQPGTTTLNSGTTSTTFTVKAKDGLAAGTYTAAVTVYADNMTNVTFAVTQTVNPAPVAPSITSQPGNKTVTAGQTATFSITASGDAPLSYQWKKDGNALTDGENISGATAATLSISNTQSGDAGSYTVVVTNAAGNASSNPATLTVNALTNAATPSIDTQPTGATVNEGDSTPNLSVAASVNDGGTLSYQWYSNSVNSTIGGNAIAGATSTTYAAPTTSTGTTYYYVVVTNTNNGVSGTKTATATSNIAAVNVNALTNAASPSIGTHPAGATVNKGDSTPNLSVATSVNDGGTLSYQWYSNSVNSTIGGNAIAGATSTTYAAPTTSTGTTYYYVVVTNTNNGVSGTKTATATSNIAAVNVNALTNAASPSIGTHPAGATVNKGDSTPNLSVAASVSDGGTLSYQWYSNSVNSTIGGNAIAGATSATYAAPTTSTGTTYYYVVVTNTNNSVSGTKTATATSNIATVNVNIAPTHTIAPIADQTLAALTQGYALGTQETKTIDVTNTGTSDLSNLSATVSGIHASDFVITQPGTTLVNGATTSAFTVKAKDGLPAGTYTATITLSATQMTDVTFTVMQVVNMPNAPENPQNLVAVGGNGEVTLNWSTVTGATYYNLYMATDPSQLSNASVVIVNSSTYNAQNLLNGTTYFFTVRAGNSGGLSGESNQANATPATVPAAPTNVSAVAGNGEATVTFTAPTENGGSPITGYEVTDSSGNAVTTGAASPIVITGLTNGTSYTFTVKAINGLGKSTASANSNAVIPQKSSGGSTVPIDTPSVPSTPTIPEKTNTGMDILVNGKAENAGTVARTQRNGQTVTTVFVDQKKLEDKLAAEGQNAVVAILVNDKSHVTVGSLNGQMVKNMEDKQAVLEIKTDRATYTIPAQQININTISEQVGKSVALQDIQVQIEISEPTTDMVKVVENAAAKGTFTLVVPPLNFTVKGIYGDKTVEVSKFNAYVKRNIVIPNGVDPGKITTGIVVETDGTIRHVPTKIVVIDGKYYAQINSLTNSMYSLVYHPLEFEDVAKHWAKQAVSDMGSRMIIDGTGNGMFSPDRDITRAEFAAIIVRALGLKTENGATSFSDVQSTDWYSSAVNTAYAYHLIGGFEDGTFRPMDTITREQAMVILSKAMAITSLKGNLAVQSTDVILRPYGDTATVSAWALSSVADTVEAGIVSGRGGNELAPKDYITRAEVAKIIQGLLQKSGLI